VSWRTDTVLPLTGSLPIFNFNVFTSRLKGFTLMLFENHLLTENQLRIIELNGNGYSRNEVARELNFSLETIRKQEAEIVEKLYAQNMAHVVAMATKLRLIDVFVPEEVARLHTRDLYHAKNGLFRKVTNLVESPRRLEIFWLLGEGLTNKEIADSLGLAIETIRSHIRKIYKELKTIHPQYPHTEKLSNEEKRDGLVELSRSFRKRDLQGGS
jgi:DNA-binding NarL/FixJ family response regulator